jgi:outer membrane protein assembly factor BamB
VRAVRISVAVSVLAVTLLSCAVYTFSPSALGGIKSVAIPLFENRTTESGLRESLTDRLSQAFVDDNTLRVVPEATADGVLRGAVVSYRREAYTYSEAEVVSEYIVYVGVDVEFVERKSGKVIWEEKNMSNWGTYDSATQTEDDGKNIAIGKLVEDILNKTVKGW